MHFYWIRWYMGLLFCLTGLILFALGAWPAGKRLSVLVIHPREMQVDLPGQAFSIEEGTVEQTPSARPAILEKRRLVLETPGFLRPGDPDTVKMEFTSDSNLILEGEVDGLSNLYDTHYAAVEARLEMGGLQVNPSGSLIRSLEPGQAIHFSWTLFPEQAQIYEGTAWLYLRFMPKNGSPSSDWPLAAQRIELTSSSWLGLSGRMTRWLGGIAVLTGLLLTTDKLLSSLKRWFKDSFAQATEKIL
jgi:hypothetical protein